MTLRFLYLFLVINIHFTAAQVFEVEDIKVFNDGYERINFVILSEGYQASELDQFITDATSFTNSLFSQSPFLEYADYFNVYAIKVPSNESGADHPGTGSTSDETGWPIPTITVDTYFNATYDSYGSHRLLYYEIDGNNANNTAAKINTVLANNFPTYDQALILVNSPYYGGSGGEFPMASTGISANEIAIHELGHSLFNLKDEYYASGFEGEAINMTQESNTSLVKWKNWINENGVHVYPYGASGVPATWYRPHQNCKMRVLGAPFCSVCKEGMIEKIHDLISPIGSYAPVSNAITPSTYPVDFQLNLIKPNPDTLESSWTLNTINFGTNVDNVSILETDLNTGSNNLTVVVTDVTEDLVKVDNHETVHVYTVTWDITKSTLGIDAIIAEENIYNISMYPNPSNTIVNLKLESHHDSRLKIEIVSLDGKRVKKASISNYETKQLNISNLSQGLYVTNFYANNTLIASKKLVKN